MRAEELKTSLMVLHSTRGALSILIVVTGVSVANAASDGVKSIPELIMTTPRPATTLYYAPLPRLDTRTPKPMIFMPSKQFSEILTITPSTLKAFVGETIKLYAVREVSGFDEVPYEQVPKYGCWEPEQPQARQSSIGEDIFWYLEPIGKERFKRGKEYCEVAFLKAGTYRIFAEDMAYCQDGPYNKRKSNTVQIEVSAGP